MGCDYDEGRLVLGWVIRESIYTIFYIAFLTGSFYFVTVSRVVLVLVHCQFILDFTSFFLKFFFFSFECFKKRKKSRTNNFVLGTIFYPAEHYFTGIIKKNGIMMSSPSYNTLAHTI